MPLDAGVTVLDTADAYCWDDGEQPTDAIVRLTTSTICGTDLHILKGDVPSVAVGRILGHEGVGVVADVGAGVVSPPS